MICLDESISKPFRLFVDFDLKGLEGSEKERKQLLYKLASLYSQTVAEFYPNFNHQERHLPASGYIDGAKEERSEEESSEEEDEEGDEEGTEPLATTGDWFMEGINQDCSESRLLILFSIGEPKVRHFVLYS